MKIEPFKMEVTPEQSKQVQEIVFRNGGGWVNGGPVVKYTDKPFLVYDEVKDLQFSEEMGYDHFTNDRPEPLITFADFMARYGGVQPPHIDTIRKLVTIAEDAYKNGDVELSCILIDALGYYIFNNRPRRA